MRTQQVFVPGKQTQEAEIWYAGYLTADSLPGIMPGTTKWYEFEMALSDFDWESLAKKLEKDFTGFEATILSDGILITGEKHLLDKQWPKMARLAVELGEQETNLQFFAYDPEERVVLI
jgi:hypothetical protein